MKPEMWLATVVFECKCVAFDDALRLFLERENQLEIQKHKPKSACFHLMVEEHTMN